MALKTRHRELNAPRVQRNHLLCAQTTASNFGKLKLSVTIGLSDYELTKAYKPNDSLDPLTKRALQEPLIS